MKLSFKSYLFLNLQFAFLIITSEQNKFVLNQLYENTIESWCIVALGTQKMWVAALHSHRYPTHHPSPLKAQRCHEFNIDTKKRKYIKICWFLSQRTQSNKGTFRIELFYMFFFFFFTCLRV